MAAAWRGAWRWTVASTDRGGGSGGGDDPVHPPPQPALPDHSYDDNCGASSTASVSTLSNTATTYATSTSASLPFPFTTTGDGGGGVTDEDKSAIREHIRDLIIHGSRGCGAATSSSSSALGRWLSELQVSWVLRLAQLDAASAGRTFVSRRLQHTARSWVLALHAMSRSVASFTGWCSSQEQEQQEEEEALPCPWPPASEFVGFVAATFLLMHHFVDAVVALDDVINPGSTSISSDDYGHGGMVSGNKGAVASAHKFRALTDVRDALSGVSEQVQLWHSCLSSSCSSPDAEAARISAEMRSLLLAKLDKVDEAMKNTRDCIRTHFMSLMTDGHGHGYTAASGVDPSPSIHIATQFAASYTIVSSTSYSYNSSSVDPPTAYEASSLSLGENSTGSSTNLNIVIIRSLEESLTRVSQSFLNQSLRFLFLANNFYFLWHQLLSQNLLSDVPTDALARKIDSYINSYLQVSWTPVLKPLHSHSSCCFFFTRYSAQRKFLSEFEKTYVAQKLWKVPDPELRKVLRTAIVDKVISAFTKFLEDGGVSLHKVPESLQEMLEELFEG